MSCIRKALDILVHSLFVTCVLYNLQLQLPAALADHPPNETGIAPPRPRPNVVFILADDLGYADVGYHGRPDGVQIRTPSIDALAKSGVTLENYYVQPVCTPTRSQLMTGRYQIHTGLQHGNINHMQPNCLPLDEVTLPQKLREHGYATHMVGKWHLGFYKDACLPTERGFDSFFGYLAGSHDHFRHTSKDYYDLHMNKTPALPIGQYDGVYSTHLFTDKAAEVIRTHDKAEKPLFIYLAYQAVHLPDQVPTVYKDGYEDITTNDPLKTVAAMVTCLDEGVGNVTQALKDAGIYNNTIIVFSSDNGGKKIRRSCNWPLRGHKGKLWEGGIRTVGFVHSPLLPETVRGTINRELMHVSDWLPTIVAGMAGGSLNGTKPLDGFNVWESIKSAAPSPRTEILHNIDPLQIREHDQLHHPTWRHSYDPMATSSPRLPSQLFNINMRAALRAGDWKILTYPQDKLVTKSGVFLFNITADPMEKFEVSSQHPDVVASLLERLEEYHRSSVPVRYPEEDRRGRPRPRHRGIWGPWVIDRDESSAKVTDPEE